MEISTFQTSCFKVAASALAQLQGPWAQLLGPLPSLGASRSSGRACAWRHRRAGTAVLQVRFPHIDCITPEAPSRGSHTHRQLAGRSRDSQEWSRRGQCRRIVQLLSI
jgi:hypothetical protein